VGAAAEEEAEPLCPGLLASARLLRGLTLSTFEGQEAMLGCWVLWMLLRLLLLLLLRLLLLLLRLRLQLLRLLLLRLLLLLLLLHAHGLSVPA